jgi:lipid A 4'-phosphatase
MKAVMIYAGILALALITFFFLPQIDLETSRLFYVSGRGFVLADWPPVVFLYRMVPWITWSILALVATAAIWLFLVGRPIWRFDRKVLIFLVASTALGPGLLVNAILKENWGRARPTQIEAFGGSRQFTSAPLPAAECSSNCAFVSGHAALGFSLVGFAFLLPPTGRLRRGAIATALVTGAVVGLGRIAQGAHFLSDVLFAGLFVYGTTALLYWCIVEHDTLAAPPLLRLYRGLGRGAAGGWTLGRIAFGAPAVRLAFVATAALILIAISIEWADRPIALFFHARDPDLRTLFDMTGRLGLTYGYLTAFGLAFVALHWGGALPRLQPIARRMRAFSAIPAFLFLSIAASGIVVDALKLFFGRTRPKLLFGYGVDEFGWLGLRPDHWSFPSGHSATIVALMTALWFLWPQHVLFYILVAVIVSLSRVAVGAHYLSDVLGGTLIALLTTWGTALTLARSGIDLVAARRGRSKDALPWPCYRFGRALVSGYRTELQEIAPIACGDREECNIGPRADSGSRIGSSLWPCASRPSTIPAAEIPSTRR